MLSGHAYARALRSHSLTTASLTALILDASSLMDEIDVIKALTIMFTVPFYNVHVPPPLSFRKMPSKSQLDRTLVHRNYHPNNVGTHLQLSTLRQTGVNEIA